MALEALQERLEREAILEAERRYRELQRTRAPSEQRPGMAFLRRTVLPLAEAVRADQEAIGAGRGRLEKYALPLLALEHTTLALVTLRTVYNRVLRDDDGDAPSVSDLAVVIGKACYWEWRTRRPLARGQRAAEPSGPSGAEPPVPLLPDLSARLLARNRSRHARRRADAQAAELERRDWSADLGPALGGRLLDLAEELDIVHFVTYEVEGAPGHTLRRVHLSEALARQAAVLSGDEGLTLVLGPEYLPMIVPPRPWTDLHGGGFLTTDGHPDLGDLVKHHRHPRHLRRLEAAARTGQLERVYQAVNALQATAWRLNKPLYALMRHAWQRQLDLPGLPAWQRLAALQAQLGALDVQHAALRARQRRLGRQQLAEEPAPGVPPAPDAVAAPGARPEPPVAETQAALDRAWAAYRAARAALFPLEQERERLFSQLVSFQTLMTMCERLLALDPAPQALYFPYQLDYRGRAYSMVATLNPQGTDAARALLEFQAGKPLDAAGEFWLAVHVADSYGYDKVPFEERIQWVTDHQAAIAALAGLVTSDGEPALDRLERLPPELKDFWAQADKPWVFLAACIEWANHDAPGFVSHLPIALDASANGLQHLSALARDPAGAEATNLCDRNRPHDIYQQVADVLATEVQHAARVEHDARAAQWLGKITRRTVKRGVMTTPYGITLDGLRRQLCEHVEEYYPGQFADPWAAASYLAPRLRLAIARTVRTAPAIMRWLQLVARTLAEECALGVAWTSPAGFPVVVEHYYERTIRVSWTPPGSAKRRQLALRVPEPDTVGIDANRQKGTIAPNFIHSLDAAHMMRSVCQLRQQHGLTSFAVIHDSYAVHACDIPVMLDVLRAEFVRIHSKPLLEEFLDEQLAAVAERRGPAAATLAQRLHGRLRAACPPPGAWDMREVLHARYMFS